jgi:hypothetical protein
MMYDTAEGARVREFISAVYRRNIMSIVLEKLFYGNLRPNECLQPANSEYLSLNRKISTLRAAYHKKLSREEYDELENLIDLLEQSTSMYSAAAYTEGFRLGAMMMIEVFGGLRMQAERLAGRFRTSSGRNVE